MRQLMKQAFVCLTLFIGSHAHADEALSPVSIPFDRNALIQSLSVSSQPAIPLSYETTEVISHETEISLPISAQSNVALKAEQFTVSGAEFLPGPDTLKGFELNSDLWKGNLFIDQNQVWFQLSNNKTGEQVRGDTWNANDREMLLSSSDTNLENECGTESNENFTEKNNNREEESPERRATYWRKIKVALTISKSLYDYYGRNETTALNRARARFEISQKLFEKFLHLGMSLALVHLKIIKDRDMGIDEHGHYLYNLLGETFTIGQLLTAHNIGKPSGKAVIGACGYKGTQAWKRGAAFSNLKNWVTFEHEMFHQLGAHHVFSECPTNSSAISPFSSVEAADGVSLMSYSNYCNLKGRLPYFGRDYPSGKSRIQAMNSVQRNNCGDIMGELTSASVPLTKDFPFPYRTIPFLTSFAIKIPVGEYKKSNPNLPINIYTSFVLDSLLPLVHNSIPWSGKFLPSKIYPFSKREPTEQNFYMIYPFDIDPFWAAEEPNEKEIFCGELSRKWGLPGCFDSSGSMIGQSIDFVVICSGNVKNRIQSGIKNISLRFQGEPFGFTGAHRTPRLFPGILNEIRWSVGGGSIAPTVDLYLVNRDSHSYGSYPRIFGKQGEDHFVLAKNISNTGFTQQVIPNVPGTYFLFIKPSDDNFLFWSSSSQFPLCKKKDPRRGGGFSSCEEGECECEEEPTPTATPLPSASPSINPTIATPTSTPTTLPNQTSTPTPSPAPTETPIVSPSATPSGCVPLVIFTKECKFSAAPNDRILHNGIAWCELPKPYDLPDCVGDELLQNECSAAGGSLNQVMCNNQYLGEKPCASCIARNASTGFGECAPHRDVCLYLGGVQCIRNCGIVSSGNGEY